MLLGRLRSCRDDVRQQGVARGDAQTRRGPRDCAQGTDLPSRADATDQPRQGSRRGVAAHRNSSSTGRVVRERATIKPGDSSEPVRHTIDKPQYSGRRTQSACQETR